MKKIILALVCTLFTINTFADGDSCTVPNSGGVVAVLDQTSNSSDSYGMLSIQAHLEEGESGKLYAVNVTVNIYDANTDKKVNSQTLKFIGQGQSVKIKKSFNFAGYTPNNSYYFKIHSASCR